MNRSPGIMRKTKNGEYMAFADLAAEKTQGVDYDFLVLDRASTVAIVAPHGGWIEHGTSELATAVAGHDFSLYLFEGLKPKRPHPELHIPSEYFDENQCVDLVSRAQIVIGMHGRAGDDPETIWLGGLGKELRDAIAVALEAAGFKAITSGHRCLASTRTTFAIVESTGPVCSLNCQNRCGPRSSKMPNAARCLPGRSAGPFRSIYANRELPENLTIVGEWSARLGVCSLLVPAAEEVSDCPAFF
ncbi:poly-gamma-glutamate hydrolase family protein [Mesorhizobium sp. Cs1330R2N1]|uniref:Poly-gamma-glutamate hydrolase family protein n=1 Tax=Mesorhizobium argentiipisi TaxID=3015175 RepID=A0ABU8KQF6_9HYPH